MTDSKIQKYKFKFFKFLNFKSIKGKFNTYALFGLGAALVQFTAA